MITIGKISEKKMMSAFGRGFQRMAMDRSEVVKTLINGGIFLFYCGILVLYAWLVYDKDDRSKLGVVSAIAVVLNDVYVYLMYNARIIRRISILSLLCFSSRCFIMLGGSDYWYYGYLAIYVWLEAIIATGIVAKRLPLNSEMQGGETEAQFAMTKKTKFMDLARVPEFIFLLITFSLVISIVIATSFEPRGVYLEDVKLGDEGISYETMTAAAILLVFTFLSILAWMRAFKRKIDGTLGTTFVYLCSRKIDTYYIMSLIMYIIAICWTLGLYPMFDRKVLLVCGFFLPAIIFCFLNIFIIYTKNGYYFIENVALKNKHITMHNKFVDKLKEKAKALKARILKDGPESVYGEENGRLVQKVIDIEVATRQALKLTKQFQNKDD